MSESDSGDTDRFEILDATTGGKHMWHPDTKDLERAVYADRREVESLEHQPSWSCEPSVLCDTRQLPFKDETFRLIAYDPPHRVKSGGMEQLSGVIEQKYGALTAETWQSDLENSFGELWRVLRPGGTLTFKWADVHKSHDEVLEAIGRSPLYGVTTERKRSLTKWWVFQKPAGETAAEQTRDDPLLNVAADGGQELHTDTERGDSDD